MAAGVILVGSQVLSVSAENTPNLQREWRGGAQSTSTPLQRGGRMGNMMGSSSAPMMRENSDKQILGKITSVSSDSVVIASPSRTDKTLTETSTVRVSSAKILKNGVQVSAIDLMSGDYVHVVLVGKVTETPLVASTVIVMGSSTRMMEQGATSSMGHMMDKDVRGMMHASGTPLSPSGLSESAPIRQGFFKRIGNFFSSFFH